jgi:hypothetical protein
VDTRMIGAVVHGILRRESLERLVQQTESEARA